MDKEFYEFLKENDPQLLNFDLSDEDLSDDAGDASINEVPEKVPRTITSYPKVCICSKWVAVSCDGHVIYLTAKWRC